MQLFVLFARIEVPVPRIKVGTCGYCVVAAFRSPSFRINFRNTLTFTSRHIPLETGPSVPHLRCAATHPEIC